MKAVALLIDDQLVRLLRRGRTWHPVDNLSGRRCRLIIDAPDEAAQSGRLPNIGLIDRLSLMNRRIEALYPGVLMRAGWLPQPWSRQPRFVAFALPDEAPARAAVETLAQEGARIASVMISSDLLWRLARRKTAPLIGLFRPGGFRLLAVHDGLPALTRRLALDDPSEFIEELRRTKSYLVRQQMLAGAAPLICYGQPPDGWREALASAWQGEGGIDWQGGEACALLAGAPRGANLAPGEWLREDRAWLIGRSALAASAFFWILAGAASVETLAAIRANEAKIDAARREINALTARAAQMTETLRAAGLSPELLRRAEAVERAWPSLATPLEQDLARLSSALEGAGGLRLDSLDWRAAGVSGCKREEGLQKSGVSPGAASPMAAAPPASPPMAASASTSSGGAPARDVAAADARALEFDLHLPEDAAPRQRARLIEALDRRLQDWPGAALRVSPLARLRSQALKSGQKEEALRFCLEIGARDKQGGVSP